MHGGRCVWILLALLLSPLVGLGLANVPLEAEVGIEPGVAPSILIEGDQGFHRPESGVRRGSGTVDDPFVISNWTIIHTAGYALRLVNTTAWVRIEDVSVPDAPGRRGIALENVSHVTIENVRIQRSTVGFFIERSTDVLLDSVRIDAVGSPPLDRALGFGIYVSDSQGIRVSDSAVADSEFPMFVWRSGEVEIEDSVFLGSESRIPVVSSTGVTFTHNHFRHVEISASAGVVSLQIMENTFNEGPRGVHVSSGSDVLLCGNTFEGLSSTAVDLYDSSGLTVRSNRFESNDWAGNIQSHEVSFLDNRVANSTSDSFSLIIGGRGSQVHGNSFVGNPAGIYIGALYPTPPGNATMNWWGDATGPSGVGPGSGDFLYVTPEVSFSPWLTAPPSHTFDCVPGQVVHPDPEALIPPTDSSLVLTAAVETAGAVQIRGQADATVDL